MYKIAQLTSIFLTPAIALGVVSLFTEPSQASSVSFACSNVNNSPTIMASFSEDNSQETMTMISFLPEYFSPKAAVENCQHTAKTLQTLYNQGQIKYLAADILEGQPTICTVASRSVGCDGYTAQVLFTLAENVDPTQALYNMLGDDFKGPEPPTSRTLSRIYHKIEHRHDRKNGWLKFW